MLPAFFTSSSELIDRWEKLVGPSESLELDVWPEFQNMTGDVISKTAFGSSYDEGTRILQLQTEQCQLLIDDAEKAYIPGYRWIFSFLSLLFSHIKDRKITLPIHL